MTALNFEQIFDDYVAATPKVFDHDRSTTMGASEIFGCIRKGFFDKRGAEFGFEPDADYDDNWGATRRGDLIENHHVVPAMLHTGMNIKLLGEEQETLVINRNSATPDGLLCDLEKDALSNYGIDDIESTRVGFEIKSIDPRANLRAEKAIHRGQTITQMGVVRELTENDEDKPVYSVLLYVNASFLNVMSIFIIKYDGKTWDVAQQRADMIWKFDDVTKFAPEGKFDNSCRYCKWQFACTGSTLRSIPENDGSDAPSAVIKEMAEVMATYKKDKKAADDAARAFEITKQATKDLLLDKKVKRLAGEDWKVSWTTVKGRKTFDKKAAADDGVDIDRYQKQGKGFDKLTVTFDD